MELEVVSYNDLLNSHHDTDKKLVTALLKTGIVGIRDIAHFEEKSCRYMESARAFSLLNNTIKQQYMPDRDAGDTQGYELGAEWFKDENGSWRIDDKKASYYAFIPDNKSNKWPREMDLQTSYMELGGLIFNVGKQVMNRVGLNETLGISHERLIGYGRMLHYHKESSATDVNPYWCGAHFDHGIFTGLIPAYYFRNGKEIAEPDEAGLYILPSEENDFQKVFVPDKSTLLFQVGEFGQLATHDQIRATKHLVRKARGEIERYTFAVFYSPDKHTQIHSRSVLAKDARYSKNQSQDGSIFFEKWDEASFEQYRARD